MHTSPSHTEICALWPTVRALATDMDVTIYCATQWGYRNFIPPWYWTRLIQKITQRHGIIVTFQQLAEGSEHRRRHRQTKCEAA